MAPAHDPGSSRLTDSAPAATPLDSGSAENRPEEPAGPRAAPADGAAGLRSFWRSRWAWGIALVGLGVFGLLAMFWTTVSSIVGIWLTSDSFGHGFLIIPICAYLMWQQRAALRRTVPRPSLWGIALAAAAAFAWLLGRLGGVLGVEQFALVAMIQGLFLAVLGTQTARKAAFPLFYLFFAVPFGTFLIAPLQDFTAQFLVHMLRATGIPVYLDGIFLQIPTGRFEVAEACAGLRFLTTSVALGMVFAYVFYTQLWRRLLFVALSIAVPIIANGFRAYGIVMLAHYSNNRIAVAADHVTYGLIFLGIVLFCLLALGVALHERRHAPTQPLAGSEPVAATSSGPAGSRAGFVTATVSVLLLAGVTSAYGDYAERPPSAGTDIALTAPETVGAWRVQPESASTWQPAFPNADAEIRQTYGVDGREVDVYVAYYAHQRQGAEVVNYQNRFADGTVWNRAGEGRFGASVNGAPLTVQYVRLLSRDGRRMVWYWYWVDGQITGNPYVAKLLEIGAKLRGGIQAAAVISVAARYDERPDEARRVLARFIEDFGTIEAELERGASRSPRPNQ